MRGSAQEEAKAIGREVDARPRLQAVIARMLLAIEGRALATDPKEIRRRELLEAVAGTLGWELPAGQDMSQETHDDWMRALDEADAPKVPA